MEDFSLKGEHWLENLQGLKWTPKLQKAIHRKRTFEIQLLKTEDNIRLLRQGRFDRVNEAITESVIVAALKSKDVPVIREVGVNCFDDLFTDNIGTWLASQVFQSCGIYVSNYVMTDTSNTQRLTTAGYGFYDGWWNAYNNTSGKYNGFGFQFGSGTTAAARGDYKIQTPLGSAPESSKFPCNFGIYSTGGTIVTVGDIVAGGFGTINEVGFIGAQWTASSYDFLLSHDILSSGVGYSQGNPLVCSLSISI